MSSEINLFGTLYTLMFNFQGEKGRKSSTTSCGCGAFLYIYFLLRCCCGESGVWTMNTAKQKHWWDSQLFRLDFTLAIEEKNTSEI